MKVAGEIGGAARPPAPPSPRGRTRPLGTPVRISGKMKTLPPLCRPAGWMALWKRLAMVGMLNARVAG